MHDADLFLGLPLSADDCEKLIELDPLLVQVFIKEQPSDYLQRVESEGITYLGKGLQSPYDMADMESLQININSLLRKLLPNDSEAIRPLMLIALSSPQT